MDGVDGDLALLVAEHHGAQHHFFRQLLGFGFHHQHGGFGAGNDQIHLRILALGLTGVQHVFAVDVTHAGCADGAVERQPDTASAAETAIMAAMSASTSGFSEMVWMTTCTSL
jgi:hypothetical protein